MPGIDWNQVLDSALNASRDGGGQIGLRSPAAEWLELPQLTRWAEGEVEASWPLDERALNSRGILFGGYYGVLADSLLALATMTVLASNEHFKTADLRLSFFRPVSEGALSLKAQVISRSRSLVHVEGSFYDEQDRLLARATAMQSVVLIED